MSYTTTSANMLLPVPIPGQEAGPQYAIDLNNCLSIIDQHNHAPGSGVQIPPSGLNINADLPFNANNATLLRSARFSSQASVLSLSSDLLCAYVVGNDLYYNDGVGNQVRITQSGGVAGTPGSISNLTSPANVAYVGANQSFVFQSLANTPGNLDGASFILRNLSANSKGLTLQPPASMGSDYTVTLPSLPAATNLLTMTTTGTIAAAANVDNSTLQFSANVLSIKAGGVGTTQMASRSVTSGILGLGAVDTTNVLDGAITPAKIGPSSASVSSSCGAFTTGSSGYVAVTNLSVTVTLTQSRPIIIALVSDGTGAASGFTSTSAGNIQNPAIYRNGSLIAAYGYTATSTGSYSGPGGITHIDSGLAPGTYTYQIYTKVNGSGLVGILNCNLIATPL